MSKKSKAEKLLIKPNTTAWSTHPSRLDLVGPLPEGVRHADDPKEAATALVFPDDAGSLRDILAAHKDRLARAHTLWVAYPKANQADINRDTLWPILAEYGMRPIGQVSVDEVWSAMRFRPDREGEAPFTGGSERRGAGAGAYTGHKKEHRTSASSSRARLEGDLHENGDF